MKPIDLTVYTTIVIIVSIIISIALTSRIHEIPQQLFPGMAFVEMVFASP